MAMTLSLEVDESVGARFERLAQYSRHTLAELQVMALERFLDEEMEHLEDILESRRDIAEGRVIPHEEIEAWVDSLGTDNPLASPRWDERLARKAS